MFDRWLSRLVKIALMFTGFTFTLMFTGVNPYSFTLFAETKPTLPQPVIFTVADMQERAMEQAPAREILFINEAEFNCLRDNIFFEARNERSLQAYHRSTS